MVHMVAEVDAHGWPVLVDAWTLELLDRLPDDGLRYELLDGTLLVSPAPTLLHQVVAANIFRLLDVGVGDEHAVLFAPLDWQPDGRTSLQPDLLVVRKDRLARSRLTDAPIVVVEIASPSSARIDRTLKLSRYAEGDVRHYWIVDPRVPSVSIYELINDDYQLAASGQGDDTVTVSAPFEVSVVPSELVRI
jgi:Uma2 family endonuclease